MFADLKDAPADPILGMAQLFAADPDPRKVDLGIGVYKDAAGDVIVLDTVKQAEQWLVETQASKGYISSAGNPVYNDAIHALIFREGSDAHGRARTVQTPGGTGALRVAGDFIHRLRPGGRIFLPDPTWANHPALFTAAGIEIVTYPYYDVATGQLRFDAMMAALEALTADDTLLVHGCCHNPSGTDPDAAQWAAIGDLLAAKGATPLVDLAYLGFGQGLEEDRAGIAILAGKVREMIVASSCSKNFALYRERTGALTLVAGTPAQADAAKGHLLPVIRANYSMPPDHGAAVVAHILGDARLRARWKSELTGMRTRIQDVRRRLVAQLDGRGGRDFSYLAEQNGMFALLGLSRDQVQKLRNDWHIYATDSGRANLAGLTADNVDYVAEAFAAVSHG